MKYLKIFELFETPQKMEFQIKKLDNSQYGYYFNLKGIEFGVYFHIFNGLWERNYFRINTPVGKSLKTYGMANRIISSVTYITNEFIKKFKPIVLNIVHIPMENEFNLDGTKLNKRAFINYNYLKNLPIIKSGKYELRYYNKWRIDPNTSKKLYGISVCLIVIKGYNGYIKIEHDENFERFYPQ